MSHKDIKALSDAYLSMYAELVEEETEEQLDEAAKTAKQIAKRADTLSKNISQFENMLKQSKPKGAGRDYDKAVDEMRSAYITLMDKIDAIEGMMK